MVARRDQEGQYVFICGFSTLAWPLHGSLPCHEEGACELSEAMSHAVRGHPRQMDHSREF